MIILWYVVFLPKGARVMLTMNLWSSVGHSCWYWLFTIYIKNPSGFKLCKWNANISIEKSRSEHALSISRKIGKDRTYIVKGVELDGKPSKMWMERNRPVETCQPVKEDNLFKHTGLAGNFPIGSTKNMCSIYFLSGITGIFMSMVNNHYLSKQPSTIWLTYYGNSRICILQAIEDLFLM